MLIKCLIKYLFFLINGLLFNKMINRYVVYVNLGRIMISTPLYHTIDPQSDTGHRTAKVYKVFHLFESDKMNIKLACELNSEDTVSS